MNRLEEDLEYERKMDHISEQLEELILNAMLTALQKIKERNTRFLMSAANSHADDIQF